MSLDLDMEDEAPAPKPARPAPKPALQAELPPDTETYLLSCCLVEPDRLAEMAHIPRSAFTNGECSPLWAALRDKVDPLDYEAMLRRGKVSIKRLLEIRGLAGLGTGFSGWLREFDDAWRRAEFQRIALDMTRASEFEPAAWVKRLESLAARGPVAVTKGVFAFGIPPEGDKSVLLGDRYLNRGDGAILSCSSGMGKSSMCRQMATMWSMGRDFHGIKPNGRLKSLEIQAEDSDGDIGEVAVSIAHMAKITPEEKETINENVLIVTERVRRGIGFLDELKRLIRKHKPDLVWLNPLQSFLDGDITEAKDLSAFLHAGLNALNAEQAFAFIIVHHTTKPPKGDQKKMGLAWNEIMYDMAGGALLINWARAIISLRPGEEKGDFNMVLAKRGTRAGVTRQVEQGAGFRDEIVTEIPLRWSRELIDIPGRPKKLRCIYWEARDLDKDTPKEKGGRPKKHNFEKFRPAFPTTMETALGLRPMHKKATTGGYGEISLTSFDHMVDDAVRDGLLIKTSPRDPKYYVAEFNNQPA